MGEVGLRARAGSSRPHPPAARPPTRARRRRTGGRSRPGTRRRRARRRSAGATTAKRRVPLLVPALGRRGEQVASELRLDRRVAGEAAEDPAAAAVVVRCGRTQEVADEPTLAERGDAARVLARELLRHLRAVVHLARQQRLDVAVPRVHVGQQAGRASRWSSENGTSSRAIGAGRYPRPCEPEDPDGRRAAARRRPCARGGALPRRRQQPRLPRLLRAARGAGDDRGLPDERAARVHEHALQAPLRLPAEGRRGGVGHAPRAPARAARDATRATGARCPTCCASSSRTSGRSSRRSATATSSSRAGRPTT